MSPSAASKEAAVVMDAAFEIDASGVLEVRVPDVHLRLRPQAEDNRVHVHGFVPDGDPDRAREVFDRRGIATHQTSDRLYVFGDDPRADADGWRWRRAHPPSPHFDLRLPASLNVEAQLPGGTVEISGLSGGVDLDVMGGSVEAEALQGPVHVRGGGGTLIARGCSGPHLDLDWAAGRVSLEDVSSDSTRLHSTAAPVDLQDLRGMLELLVNGASATLRDVAGPCEAQVRGGALTYYGAPEDETRLTAVGGPLYSHLPPSHAATLTLIGEQSVLDDAFSFEGEQTLRHIEGTLNGGGPPLRLKAVRGAARCSAQNDA